jgi:hypothetical protein
MTGQQSTRNSGTDIAMLDFSTKVAEGRQSGMECPHGYPGGLGVIREDAPAELLLIEDNPPDDIEIATRPAKTLPLLKKAGGIHQNTTAPTHGDPNA